MTSLNASLPLAGSGYSAEAHAQISGMAARTVILLLVNIPVLAILLNVARQLVIPRRKTDPPIVFHWLPFVGSAIAYGNNPLKFFFECREKHGDVFTFILLGRHVTVALGPRGNSFILGGKSITINAEDAYTPLTTPVFRRDVIYDVPTVERPALMKRFCCMNFSSHLRAYVGMIEEEVEDYINKESSFRTFQTNDIEQWGQFDVIQGHAGNSPSSRLQEPFRARRNSHRYTTTWMGDSRLPNLMLPNLPLESYRKCDRAQKKMSDFYVDIIRKRKTGHSEAEHDMISTLLEQTYRDGEGLKDHQVAHLMIALLMAGQHTSSASGSWALLHLAHNKDIADALYREQVQHFGTSDGALRPMTYEELRALPVLDSVIRETLRVHPPIHSIMRHVREDIAVPGTLSNPGKDKTYIISKGNFEWDPSRWSDPEGVAAQAFNTYVDDKGEKIDYGFGAVSKGTESPYQPFGAGKHRFCAYMQLGTLLATVIRKVELRIDAVPEYNYHTMITMPKEPRSISYRRRKAD
ncbi:lanosterol 14-alpha-demethylase [Ephemerocybe angulata]|uniref:Lanosterol 14-alpha-demethylase n=1 Tax=Ephemerocybe angulata TaxID=980116 RepID=A0A8H6MDC4_9AGAR|nr:lanosterol 14-alpha-demethylase [Tulosesus angulatus]